MPRAAVVSFRLGGGDGVSIESAKWAGALRQLGFDVTTTAGDGAADHIVAGLAIGATATVDPGELAGALRDADLVVVENLCSLPLNPAAAKAVCHAIAGRPAILHHHDLPWQRPRFAGCPPPADDPAWRHVTINERSRRELAAHGIAATTIYNTFDPDPPPGRRDPTRAALGVSPDARVLLQPTRALERKRIDAGIALAEALGAVYWLLGPPEDGYGPELERILAHAHCPIRRGREPTWSVDDAYAACDAVVLLSSWEGFGNPALESATHRRPLCIGPYPVAEELAAFGFEWFTEHDVERIGRCLARPDHRMLEHNAAIARRSFSTAHLPARLAPLLDALGVLPPNRQVPSTRQ